MKVATLCIFARLQIQPIRYLFLIPFYSFMDQHVNKNTDLMRLGTQEMLGVLEVKGDATEASSSDREIPL